MRSVAGLILLVFIVADAVPVPLTTLLPADLDDGFELQMLAPESGALCLDGTPGGFYFRPGDGDGSSSWLVHFEGGGWCISDEDCLARSKTDIGSSKNWPSRGLPSMDGGAHGILSNNPTINPDFYNWNMVHVNYCDGASYAGNVGGTYVFNGTNLYFRGRFILDAVITKLLDMGVSSAKELIVKGCSAGGLAIYIHIDHIRTRVPISVRVIGAPDSGFFLDVPDWAGNPSYTPLYQWIFKTQNATGSTNQECVADQKPGEEWKCFMAPYALPYIRTPLFVFNAFYDAWQLQHIVKLPCLSNISACNATEMAAFLNMRNVMDKGLEILKDAGGGLFLESCVIHGLAGSDQVWSQQMVGKQSMRETFAAWYYQRPGLEYQEIDCEWPCDSHCLPFSEDDKGQESTLPYYVPAAKSG